MSYERFNHTRTYCKGTSQIYALGADEEGIQITLQTENPYHSTFKIKSNDMFELVMSMLDRSDIKLDDLQRRRLAAELFATLRVKPETREEHLQNCPVCSPYLNGYGREHHKEFEEKMRKANE